jgi:hypothetical protein
MTRGNWRISVSVKGTSSIFALCAISIACYHASYWRITDASQGETMKAITLRSLPPELAEAVRKEAERKRTGDVSRSWLIILLPTSSDLLRGFDSSYC